MHVCLLPKGHLWQAVGDREAVLSLRPRHRTPGPDLMNITRHVPSHKAQAGHLVAPGCHQASGTKDLMAHDLMK